MSGTLSQGPGGGIIPPGQAGVGNPFLQRQVEQMAQVPTEQLQQMAARGGNSPQGQMAQRLLQQRHFMPNAQPQASSGGITAQQPGTSSQPGTGIAQTQQATAAGVALPPTTNAMRRGGGIVRRQHFDMGGMPSSQEDPWWTRSEAHGESGLIHAYTPGRTDTINMEPLAESHIIPADVISGLGEGNTLAGAAVMDRIVNSAPFGTQMPRGSHGRGPPAPPHVSSRQFESRGGQPVGKLGQRVPIIAAGGEYKVSPEQVLRLGRGSYKRGHDLLDAFILEVRKRTIKDMKNLPGPKK
jgi:hypothetical protein